MGAEASERSSVSLDQRHLMKAIFGGWKREREGHICPHPSNPTAAGEQLLDPNKWHNSESPQTVANHFLLSLANTTITHIMNHQCYSAVVPRKAPRTPHYRATHLMAVTPKSKMKAAQESEKLPDVMTRESWNRNTEFFI